MLRNHLQPIRRSTPVRIQILSLAENTYVIHNELTDILVDASSSCEYMGYVDKDGSTRVKIECTVTEHEKQCTLDRLRLKHAADYYVSEEPTNLSIEPISMS